MTEKSWSADRSVVLRHRVLMVLADRQRAEPTVANSNGDVAAALGEDVTDVIEMTTILIARGLCWAGGGVVPASSPVTLTSSGAALAAEWTTSVTSKRLRRLACRDALLDCLYEQAGKVLDATAFLPDVRARYFGDPFTEKEATEALGYLGEVGLAKGIGAWNGSLLRPQLTADGKTCVERFDGDIGAWLARNSSQTLFSISNSQGVMVASNSPGATQTMTITTDARQQMVQAASALLATLPVLGLDPEDVERANDVAQRLREEAEHEASEPGRLRALLKDARTIAVSGTGSAAGVGIVALVAQISQSLGL